MAHRMKLADVTQADLAAAEVIAAVDATIPGYYKQVWTLPSSGAEAVQPPSAKLLEVEVDSLDPDEYDRLKQAVEAAKASFLEGTWDVGA
jgi:hypothetical protein